jgi:putative ABC transport system permease protein
VLGVALLVQGMFGGGPAVGRLSAMAGGAVLIFIGVALAARYVVRPLAGALGWPIEHAFHEPGRLARENAMRNPARTATTSAALMIGLALVVFVAVFASGLRSSIIGSLDDRIESQVIVTGKGFQPIPAGAGEVIDRVEGVRTASPVYGDQVEVDGKPSNLLTDILDGVDPDRLLEVYAPEWLGDTTDATVTRLHGDTALVEEQFAEAHGIRVGERFRVETVAGGTATLTAIGAYRDPQIMQGAMVDVATFRRLSSLRDPVVYFVATDAGASPAGVRDRIDAALQRFPTAEVRTDEEYRGLISDQVNQIVYLLYALLAMSLVISLFGIANSVFLSIHERVREFGLLRAVGATRAQVRQVVRYESIITAVIGGVLGMLVGLVFAALSTAALSDLGLTFSLPAGQLVILLGLAVLVGIAGSVIPARRAADVDVLDAMRHD